MSNVVIVDYGMGNLGSVARAVEECGGKPLISDSPKDLRTAERIILPGVGTFSDGMRNIQERGFYSILQEEVMDKKIPFLGICLGMQLIAEAGLEGGKSDGFGWIKGVVIRLKSNDPNIKIPHIGWNKVGFLRSSLLFKDIPDGKDFYFVHSYHFVCKNEENVIARTPYSESFVSAVGKENIFGVQFHPEKSQRFGLKLISNFLSI